MSLKEVSIAAHIITDINSFFIYIKVLLNHDVNTLTFSCLFRASTTQSSILTVIYKECIDIKKGFAVRINVLKLIILFRKYGEIISWSNPIFQKLTIEILRYFR